MGEVRWVGWDGILMMVTRRKTKVFLVWFLFIGCGGLFLYNGELYLRHFLTIDVTGWYPGEARYIPPFNTVLKTSIEIGGSSTCFQAGGVKTFGLLVALLVPPTLKLLRETSFYWLTFKQFLIAGQHYGHCLVEYFIYKHSAWTHPHRAGYIPLQNTFLPLEQSRKLDSPPLCYTVQVRRLFSVCFFFCFVFSFVCVVFFCFSFSVFHCFFFSVFSIWFFLQKIWNGTKISVVLSPADLW